MLFRVLRLAFRFLHPARHYASGENCFGLLWASTALITAGPLVQGDKSADGNEADCEDNQAENVVELVIFHFFKYLIVNE